MYYSSPPSSFRGIHFLPRGKFLEMEFREEGSKDRFLKEYGLGKFNLGNNINIFGKLVAWFNLV